jgi:hypothetical protein
MREATLPGLLRGLHAVCVAALLLHAVACGSSSDTFVAPAPSRCGVQAETSTNAFAATGGSGSIRISTNRECTWAAQSGAAWIALPSQASGTGDGSIQFTVTTNADPSSRTGELRVNDQRLEISQAGTPCRFDLSSTQETMEASGGQRTIEVQSSSSQCTWSAASDAAWIRIVSGEHGTGAGRVVFEVAPTAGPSRAGTLTIGGAAVQVTQGIGCAYSTNVTALNLSAGGGRGDVSVAAAQGCPWTARSEASWISITTGPSGSGPGIVGISATPNDGPPRAGTVAIAGVRIAVTQSSGCSLTINPTGYAAPAAGGANAVSVLTGAGCSWSASSAASWIAITSGASGSGPGQVQFNVAANSGPARSASLAIGGQAFAISQATGCTFSINPSSMDVTATAQSVSVTLSTAAGCSWTAGTDAGWISLAQPAGSGPGQVSVLVSANNGPPRSASLAIAGRPLTIAQASPCTWTAAPPVHDFNADGGLGTVLVIVDGPCAWSAVSTVNWITVVTGASGAGNGLVQFLAAQNPGSARTGIIRIGALDYLVRQSGR